MMIRRGMVQLLILVLLALPLGAQTGEEAVVLAVMPFRSIGESINLNLGDSFSETITTKLIGLRGLKVYERAQFDKINAELSFQRDATDMVDQASLARAGSVVSLDYMILGSVTLAGQKLGCQLRLVRVRDGQAVLSTSYEGEYPKTIFELQDTMALDLASSLKLKLSDLDKKRLAKKPTENLDSWALYNKSLGSGSPKERIPLLEKAIAADPGFIQASHLLADLYTEVGEPEKARKVYASILGQDPADHRAVFNQAMLTFDRGDYYSARDLLSHALVLKPGDPDILYHLGLFHEFNSRGDRLGQGSDPALSLKLYDQAIQSDPLHRESLLAAGMLRLVLVQEQEDPVFQLAMLKLARNHLNTYSRIAPDTIEAQEVDNTLVQVNGLVGQLEDYLSTRN